MEKEKKQQSNLLDLSEGENMAQESQELSDDDMAAALGFINTIGHKSMPRQMEGQEAPESEGDDMTDQSLEAKVRQVVQEEIQAFKQDLLGTLQEEDNGQSES